MAIKRKATAAPAVTTILHETDSKGLHRIVTLANGKALYGDWTPHNQVARLGALLAATAHHAYAPARHLHRGKQGVHRAVNIPVCGECEGIGQVHCDECGGAAMDGEGDVCMVCNGTGLAICLACDGTGEPE